MGAGDVGCDGDGQMGLAGAGAADKDDVALCREERAGVALAHQPFIDRGPIEPEGVDILGDRQLGGRHPIADRSSVPVCCLGPQLSAPLVDVLPRHVMPTGNIGQ